MDHTRPIGQGRMFVLSFVVTFLVMGFMVVFLLLRLYVPTTRPAPVLPQQQNAVYLPSAEERLTLLLAVEGQTPGSDTFLLAGFFPDIGYMPLMALPRQLAVGETTLQQLYRTEGISKTAQSLAEQYQIGIDRVAAAPGASFSGLWDRMGSVDFRLPLRLEDQNGQLVLAAGLHQFDGQKALGVMNAPLWPGGESQRCGTVAALMAQAVNHHLPLVLGERAEGIFKTAVNGCTSTDLSSLDYEQYLPAARFMARLEVSPAQPLELSGSYGAAGSFVPDQSGLELLRNTF